MIQCVRAVGAGVPGMQQGAHVATGAAVLGTQQGARAATGAAVPGVQQGATAAATVACCRRDALWGAVASLNGLGWM